MFITYQLVQGFFHQQYEHVVCATGGSLNAGALMRLAALREILEFKDGREAPSFT